MPSLWDCSGLTSYTSDGSVGPWAREKLSCLEKYLAAYTTILRKQDWCDRYFYFDAFAGAGTAPLRTTRTTLNDISRNGLLADLVDEIHSDKDVVEYVKGSPHVSMGINHPFTEYYFVEQEPAKAAQLRIDLEREYAHPKVEVIEGDANEAIYRILINGSFNWQRTRGVVFLDPFGLHVPWKTLEDLAACGAVEVIINLPIGMAIQRLLPSSGNFSQSDIERLNRYFGSPDWFDVAYERKNDMFGESLAKHVDAGHRLANWYRGRLKHAFGQASRARLIRNHRGGHLYYLIWAGRNETGRKIASDILKQGEVI